MTILKALKNLIAKSGGTTKAGTIAEAINDMPVGGGGPLVVTVTGNDEIDFVADKTYAEILAAAPNVVVDYFGDMFYLQAARGTVVFKSVGFVDTGDEVYQETITIGSDNSITYQYVYYTLSK